MDVLPSAPSELAWILDLLVQRAPYAAPALEELEQSLLPGIARLRAPVGERVEALWDDGVPGCTELLLAAHAAGALHDTDQRRLFAWLGSRGSLAVGDYELRSEPESVGPAIRRRLDRLAGEASLRRRYLDLLSEVWRLGEDAWERSGIEVVTRACGAWRERLSSGTALQDLVAPRHPLTRAEELGLEDLLARQPRFVISPLYFCMSGGQVVDVGEYVHVAVAASDLLPIRKRRDAAFVADRLRVLAEPTRVLILIQLMSAPSRVMDLARTLRISQAAVSAHVKVLQRSGVIQRRRLGSRTVLTASRKRIERLLEDARGTLSRWD